MDAVVKSLPQIKKNQVMSSGKSDEVITIGDQDASGDEVDFEGE